MRSYEQGDYERALEICIAAFEPIHGGFETALGSKIFRLRYHDWKEQYAVYLSGISPANAGTKVYVAVLDGTVSGFIFTTMDTERKIGQIGLNAVDQGQGIGKTMYDFALRDLKERGAEI